MIKKLPLFIFSHMLISLFLLKANLYAQAENVDINHRVYNFLHRLEIKGLIENYSSSNIPLSRKEITGYILEADKQIKKLNTTEQGILEDLKIEFEYDLNKTINNAQELISDNNSFFEGLAGIINDKPKYFYSYFDSSNSLFMKAFFSAEYRMGRTIENINKRAALMSWGGNIRGTIDEHFGYSLIASNGQISGDKDFAMLDPALKGNYKINEPDAVNFDFTEGYVAYSSRFLSFELGRDKASIGTGIIDKVIVNPASPSFDLIRGSARIGNFRYSFMHSSLLEKTIPMMIPLPIEQQVINPKYLALHRIEVGFFNDRLNLGFTEMTIYGKRPMEIAYLTPLIFFKSVEHSQQDRDNSMMVFDAKIRPFPTTEIYGSFLIDDITFGKLGTKWWANLFTYQIGGIVVDCFRIENLDMFFEYTRLDPYVYSHRQPGNSYTNNIYSIGPDVQPNSDKISLGGRWNYNKRTNFTGIFSYIRHGANIKDASGSIIRNVGGDINLGHRNIDSEESIFLDGDLEKTINIRLAFSYEPIRDISFYAVYEYIIKENDTANLSDNFFSLKIKLNY